MKTSNVSHSDELSHHARYYDSKMLHTRKGSVYLIMAEDLGKRNRNFVPDLLMAEQKEQQMVT